MQTAKLNGITKWFRNGAAWDARLVLTEMVPLWDQNGTNRNGIQMAKLNGITKGSAMWPFGMHVWL